MKNRKVSPAMITELAKDEIFVFGSNIHGMHGGGAARTALKWGAVMGKGVGLYGQTYAIPTMGGSVEGIKPYIDEFIEFAKQHTELIFLVTEIGCGIAGYTHKQIAPLFMEALEIENIYLPQRFLDFMPTDKKSENELEGVGVKNTYKIGDNLYAGEYPGDKVGQKAVDKLPLFDKVGIIEFIDLTDSEGLAPYEHLLLPHMEHNRFPIKDVSVPSLDDMYNIVSYIEKLQYSETKTYIHCRGGVGRTGTTVACYFILQGDSPEVALKKLHTLWLTCSKSKRRPYSPETGEQRDFVFKFAEYMVQKRVEIAKAKVELSRIEGCLIGGAVGDALGYAVEFDSIGVIKERYGERGITRYSLVNGVAQISDDTQMTLFTANGLLYGVTRGFTYGIMAAIENYVYEVSYMAWLKTQSGHYTSFVNDSWKFSWLKNIPELNSCRAPGNTCLSALRSKKMGTIESPINDSKGCGGVMRVAPVGIFFLRYPNYREDYEAVVEIDTSIAMTGAKIAAITHGHELGYIPAAMLSHLIWSIIEKRDDFRSLNEHVERSLCVTRECFRDTAHIAYFERLVRSAIELSSKGIDDVDAIKQLGEGWVGEEALAIAIYAALKYQNSFEQAIVASVNHSGDSDSTGAICGNIIGAHLGIEAIPDYYLEKLELRDTILEMCGDLHTGCIIGAYYSHYTKEKRLWGAKYIHGDKNHTD